MNRILVLLLFITVHTTYGRVTVDEVLEAQKRLHKPVDDRTPKELTSSPEEERFKRIRKEIFQANTLEKSAARDAAIQLIEQKRAEQNESLLNSIGKEIEPKTLVLEIDIHSMTKSTLKKLLAGEQVELLVQLDPVSSAVKAYLSKEGIDDQDDLLAAA
jgi:hypothetical protein